MWAAREATAIKALLANHRPGPGAREHLDRTLAAGQLDDTPLTPDRRDALQQALRAVAAGKGETAAAIWDRVRDEQPGSAMLSVQMFLLSTCP